MANNYDPETRDALNAHIESGMLFSSHEAELRKTIRAAESRKTTIDRVGELSAETRFHEALAYLDSSNFDPNGDCSCELLGLYHDIKISAIEHHDLEFEEALTDKDLDSAESTADSLEDFWLCRFYEKSNIPSKNSTTH